MPTQHVLLMRHVAGFKGFHSGVGDEAPSATHSALLARGVQAARAIAERLRETLEELPPVERMRVGAVWHAPGPEPTATAQIVSRSAGLSAPTPLGLLKPTEAFPGGGPDAALALRAVQFAIESHLARDPARALLIVGHEPQLAWLAHRMTRRHVPIDRGELVCLALAEKGRWRLTWTIHPDDRSAVSDIREKIKSKMDAAKVLGAFVTALVTFVLAQFAASSRDITEATWGLRALTVLLLFAAASLFFISLFHYDSLLMPIRFWGSSAPRTPEDRPWTRLLRRRRSSPDWLVQRPPSSSAWVLYQNMQRIWNRTFVPAVWCVGTALITFCQAVLRPDRFQEWWVLPAGALAALLVVGWTRASRPRLGAQD